MINQQLVEYVKQQLQAGVSKDVVRKALNDAGWPPADVDDSMKAGEPAASPSAPAQPAAAQPTINPVVAMGGVDSMAKPTGSVSPSAASSPASPSASAGGSASDKFFARSAAMQSGPEHSADAAHPSTTKFMIAMIAMGVVILLLAGALGFVYFNLNGQLDAAQQVSGGDSGQLATLQNQASQLTKEKADLTAQVASLTADNAGLVSELGFFAAPAAGSSGTSTPAISATAEGLLTGNGSVPYTLTTAHNVKIYVANYKDAKVQAALGPLANTTSTVRLTGTHAPASPNLTVTAVNGTAL